VPLQVQLLGMLQEMEEGGAEVLTEFQGRRVILEHKAQLEQQVHQAGPRDRQDQPVPQGLKGL
jgi:hypothetical protein